MLEYKVIKFPPWLFYTVPDYAIGRKIHAPDSHWCQRLPWFCLLRKRPWTIQATVGATVGWQRSDSRSDIRGSGATTEQQQTDNGAIAERQRSDSRATAEQHQEWQESDSRCDSRRDSVATAWATAAAAERQQGQQRSDSRSDRRGSDWIMIQVDCQWQQSFDLPCFQVANRNNDLSLSWVAVLF